MKYPNSFQSIFMKEDEMRMRSNFGRRLELGLRPVCVCVCLFSFSSRGDFGVGVCVDVKGLPFIAIGLLSYIIILLDYKLRVRCIPPLPTLPIPSTTINHRPSTLMVTEHCQTPTTILAKRTIFVTPSTIPELCFF